MHLSNEVQLIVLILVAERELTARKSKYQKETIVYETLREPSDRQTYAHSRRA